MVKISTYLQVQNPIFKLKTATNIYAIQTNLDDNFKVNTPPITEEESYSSSTDTSSNSDVNTSTSTTTENSSSSSSTDYNTNTSIFK